MTDKTTEIKNLPKDLRNAKFGIALSGGGYRAAAFHLGTLAYLDRIKMLPQLSRISTVSGGTFTGMKYISSLIEKDYSFKKYFQTFYKFLNEVNVLKRGLQNLSENDVRALSGERKMITSMADVYAEKFLQMPNGKPYTMKEIFESEILIEEIIFNATEFRTGVAFRFQKAASKGAMIGNGNVFIPKSEAEKVRMADILAASSCFPGGFEPMKFPQDFAWPDNKIPDDVLIVDDDDQLYPIDSIALMDGGIYDNQGVESLTLADGRKNHDPLDLYIISDVGSRNNDIYPYPLDKKTKIPVKLKWINWFLYSFLIVTLITALSTGYGLRQKIENDTLNLGDGLFSVIMPFVLVLIVLFVLWYVRRTFYNLLSRVPKIGLASWNYLKEITVDDLFFIMQLRLSSLLALTSSIFMKRVKGLVFNVFYEDPKYAGKDLLNRIDRLTEGKHKLSAFGDTPVSNQLRTIAVDAKNMPTTLWFDNEDQLKSLIVSGQATICYNLLFYISRVYQDNLKDFPEVETLWDELIEDWKKMNQNPKWLLDKLLN